MNPSQPTLGDEQTLSSGAKLRIQIAPFAVSKALFQAVLREAKGLDVHAIGDVEIILLKAFALGFSSRQVEDCLWACFERCTYNAAKIDATTFEPLAAREDYVKVCVEVAKANIFPFMNSLFAAFKTGMSMAEKALESKPTTTT